MSEHLIVRRRKKLRKSLVVVVAILMTLSLNAGDSKLAGDVYFDYTFEDADKSSFNLNRAYFTFQKKVSDQLSYKFQTDIGSGGASDFSVYLKKANVAWKSDLGKFVFGLQGMNVFGVQESNWGYRFIDKSAIDKAKFSNSADLGIGWEKSMGAITPSAIISNGTGYKKAEDDAYKKLSFRLLYGKAKLKQGLNAGVIFSHEPEDFLNDSGKNEKGAAQVFAAFAGFAKGPLKAGADVGMKSSKMLTDKSANVLSVYGSYKIREMLTAFGRFDMTDPDADTNDDAYYYMIIGMDYHPSSNFYLAPNLMMKMPESGDAHSVYKLSFRFKI